MSRVSTTTHHSARGSTPQRPEQPIAPSSHSRLGTVLLVGAAAAVLAVLVTVAVVLLTGRGQERPAANPEPATQPAVPVAAVEPVAPRKAEPPAAAAPRSDQLLEALGGLSAAHLYQNFLNIGLLADAVENETYTQAEALKMLNTTTGLMDLVERNLEALKQAGLEGQDLKSIEKICRLTGLLRTQATALRAYWEGGNQEQVTRYHAAREQAWAALSELLTGQEVTR